MRIQAKHLAVSGLIKVSSYNRILSWETVLKVGTYNLKELAAKLQSESYLEWRLTHLDSYPFCIKQWFSFFFLGLCKVITFLTLPFISLWDHPHRFLCHPSYLALSQTLQVLTQGRWFSGHIWFVIISSLHFWANTYFWARVTRNLTHW